MEPKEIVQRAEAAYQAQDVDRIMELFDPEIVLYWNGELWGEGSREVRQVHEEMFADDLEAYEIRKQLRAASGDTIAVEWQTSWLDREGTRNEGYGGEFWTMREDRLREWHAYHARHVRGGTGEEDDGPYLGLGMTGRSGEP